MSWFGDLFAREQRLHPKDPGLAKLWGVGVDTNAGVAVTEETALMYGAVFGCVRILAESVAQLPLFTYRRRPDGGKDLATEHPLYALLHDSPNPEMTAYEFRETLQGFLGTWGNAYAEIEWSRGGRPLALWPLFPNMMRVERESGRLVYYYTLPDGGPEKPLDPMQVLHLRGLGSNGIVGYSPIGLARQAIGLGMAAEEFGSRFFGNGAHMAGVLRHPGVLGEKAADALDKQWKKLYSGLSNAHRIAVLEEGMDYLRIGIPPEDAQFLETRKFQVQEIARFYRVPPHMLADLDRATFSNIEHQGLEFVIHTLGPWLERWEQRLMLSLLTARERQERRVFVEHLVAGLLRGDIVSRYQAYAQGRQNGWLSANDIRGLENMNPVEGGDVYLVPLNMVPADSLTGADSLTSLTGDRGPGTGERTADRRPQTADLSLRQQRSAGMRRRLQQAHMRIFEEAAGRILRREANDVGNQARKQLALRMVAGGTDGAGPAEQRDMADFLLWVSDFYEEHKAFIFNQFRPVVQAYAELVAAEAGDEVASTIDEARLMGFVRAYVEAFAGRHAGMSQAAINRALQWANEHNADPLERLEETFTDWRENRPARVALRESVRSNSAVAVLVYTAAAMTGLRWISFGEDCPYCKRLNGRVISIGQAFIAAGEAFDAEDENQPPLTPSRDVGHPPGHDGCDCMVLAERI